MSDSEKLGSGSVARSQRSLRSIFLWCTLVPVAIQFAALGSGLVLMADGKFFANWLFIGHGGGILAALVLAPTLTFANRGGRGPLRTLGIALGAFVAGEAANFAALMTSLAIFLVAADAGWRA